MLLLYRLRKTGFLFEKIFQIFFRRYSSLSEKQKSPDRQNIFLFCLSGPLAHVSGLTPTFLRIWSGGDLHVALFQPDRVPLYAFWFLYPCGWHYIHALVPAADATAYHCKSACPASELYRASLIAQTDKQLSAIKAVCPDYAQTIPLHLFSLPFPYLHKVWIRNNFYRARSGLPRIKYFRLLQPV